MPSIWKTFGKRLYCRTMQLRAISCLSNYASAWQNVAFDKAIYLTSFHASASNCRLAKGRLCFYLTRVRKHTSLTWQCKLFI